MLTVSPSHRLTPAPAPAPAASLVTQLRARLRLGSALKALTICQPYAELIAAGDKRVENRSWPTRHRGLLAIHAGKGREWMSRAGGAVLRRVHRPLDDLEYGAIVAVGSIENCVAFTPGVAPPARFAWLETDLFATGPYCLILSWSLRLARPVACRGAQGLWNISGQTLAQIIDALDEAPGDEAPDDALDSLDEPSSEPSAHAVAPGRRKTASCDAAALGVCAGAG